MKKVLLAEDDFDLAQVVTQYLQLHGFEVHPAENGQQALEIFRKQRFDICILDVMMPVMDGFTLAEQLLEINPETPFVFLTARQLKEDKIRGLQLGADDYIVKPFEVEELVLRINNILKRSENNKTAVGKEIGIGSYVFDPKRMCLRRNESISQQLTEKEAALILFLYERKNQLVKREEILQAIWKNDDFFSGRSMDVFISKLRKYFREDARIKIESTRFIGLEFKISDKQ